MINKEQFLSLKKKRFEVSCSYILIYVIKLADKF